MRFQLEDVDLSPTCAAACVIMNSDLQRGSRRHVVQQSNEENENKTRAFRYCRPNIVLLSDLSMEITRMICCNMLLRAFYYCTNVDETTGMCVWVREIRFEVSSKTLGSLLHFTLEDVIECNPEFRLM